MTTQLAPRPAVPRPGEGPCRALGARAAGGVAVRGLGLYRSATGRAVFLADPDGRHPARTGPDI
jgi:hypothetical protein